MLNNSRGGLVLIIPIVLVILALVGTGGYFFMTRSSPVASASPYPSIQPESSIESTPSAFPTISPAASPSPQASASVSTTPIPGWNTFESESGKFSFQYPENWMYKPVKELFHSELTNTPILFNSSTTIDRDNYLLEVAYTNIPFSTIVKSFNYDFGNDKVVSLVEDMVVQGKKAIKANVQSVTMEDPKRNAEFNKYTALDVYMIQIADDFTIAFEYKKSQKEIAQKILSTLQFK